MSQSQPNILLIMADQLAAPALPFYGHPIVKAPHMAALAARGVVFESAYCNSPLCAPSRFSMMTGRLPSKTGAYDNAAEHPASIPTLAHGLRALGYRTCLAGKMHFIGPDQLHGFEERVTTDIYPADFGWTPNWDAPEERIDWWYHNMASVRESGVAEATNQLDYDDETAFAAERFLRDAARTADRRPFMLTVSFTHPHDPYVARKDYWDLYEGVEIDPPRVGPIPFEDLDAHSRRLRRVSLMDEPAPVTAEEERRARRAYYASVSYVDGLVGRLLDALGRLGMADDTVVLIAADHGDMLGERGLWYKMHFYEWALRVPLVMMDPRGPSGRRVRTPVSLVDLLPTLLELGGGGPVPPDGFAVDGRSLLPLVAGVEEPGRTVLAEYLAEGALAPILMVRRDGLKLVWSEADPPLLFDLDRDPDELVNLAPWPEGRALLGDLEAEVRRRWDPAALRAAVLDSQRRRRLAWKALATGQYTPWDYQPKVDASRQYARNFADLDRIEGARRFPPA